MNGKKTNIVIGAGETFVLEGTYTDSNGNPVDLLRYGYAVALVVARFGNEVGTYLASKDHDGNYKFNVPKETTVLWPVGRSSYRIVLQAPGGQQFWLQYGALTVLDGNRL